MAPGPAGRSISPHPTLPRPQRRLPTSQTKAPAFTLCFRRCLEGPRPQPTVHLAKFYSAPKAPLKCHFCCLVLPESQPHQLPLNPSLPERSLRRGIHQAGSEFVIYASVSLPELRALEAKWPHDTQVYVPRAREAVPPSMPQSKPAGRVYEPELGKPRSFLSQREREGRCLTDINCDLQELSAKDGRSSRWRDSYLKGIRHGNSLQLKTAVGRTMMEGFSFGKKKNKLKKGNAQFYASEVRADSPRL